MCMHQLCGRYGTGIMSTWMCVLESSIPLCLTTSVHAVASVRIRSDRVTVLMQQLDMMQVFLKKK